jgi:leucyl/phenylalanyl-tRNA--protein transferase
MLTWLESTDTPFPHPDKALPEGLLAVGGELTTDRLEQAYRQGIFPWFNPGDPVLWWSPDPRMVLACSDLKISHSLAKRLRQIQRTERLPDAAVKVTINKAFAQVLDGCAAPRAGRSGTWISPAMQQAYMRWHHAGKVYSVETWVNQELVGGLYGVCLGRFFFGESMFSRQTDCSKIALVYLVRFLQQNGIQHIDCQQETRHLASMGAQPITRAHFLERVRLATAMPALPWPCGQLSGAGELVQEPGNAP